MTLLQYKDDVAYIKNHHSGTSLAVQWLRLRVSTAGGVSSIPDRGSKISPAAQPKCKY